MAVDHQGDTIVDMMANFTYCPANVSLAAIKQGEISSCFIDTVINPLLLLVAAAAGKGRVCLICLHAPLRSSSVEALQEVLHSHRDRKHSTQPAVCLSNSLSTADSCGHHCRLRVIRFMIFRISYVYKQICSSSVFGYNAPIAGVQVFSLVTMLVCWSGSCTLTSLERYFCYIAK